MEDYGAVIHEDPVGRVVAFYPQGLYPQLAKLKLHIIAQGLHLGGARALGNDEIIGQGGDVRHSDDFNICGLVLVERNDRVFNNVFGFHAQFSPFRRQDFAAVAAVVAAVVVTVPACSTLSSLIACAFVSVFFDFFSSVTCRFASVIVWP